MGAALRAAPRPAAGGSNPAHHLRRALPLGLLACMMIAITLTGCSPIQPWVKPYQREHLADPIMSFDPHPASAAYLDHIYAVRQAARGGTGAVGGGCGCN